MKPSTPVCYAKSAPRQTYSTVKLAYTIFAPYAKPLHVRTTHLMHDEPRRILLRTYFEYADFTPLQKVMSLLLLKGLNEEVKSLAKSVALG